jgi:hypothetical protein
MPLQSSISEQYGNTAWQLVSVFMRVSCKLCIISICFHVQDFFCVFKVEGALLLSCWLMTTVERTCLSLKFLLTRVTAVRQLTAV